MMNEQPWPTAEFVIGDFDYHDESKAIGNATFLRKPGSDSYYCYEWNRELTPQIGFFSKVTEYWPEGEKPKTDVGENTVWQDVVQAVSRLESNLDSYERGYKAGRKDEREHAKTLRDPARLAEIQQLQEALRRKSEKYRRLRAQYKQLKDAKRELEHPKET